MSIFDTAQFTRALFYPRAEESRPPAGAKDIYVDVPGAKIHVRQHAAENARVRLLLFHGNGEVVADYDGHGVLYANAGAALTVADYRGYGESTGTPSLRAVIEDARVIAEAVRDERPLVVMGRSLGGAAAHELYARPIEGMVGVVLESTFSDLDALVRRRGLEPQYGEGDKDVFDPLPKLEKGTLPLLLLHGDSDTLIQPGEAKRAFEIAGSAKKELVMIPERGHNNVSYAQVYWDALAKFVASLSS